MSTFDLLFFKKKLLSCQELDERIDVTLNMKFSSA